jgi:ribonuclease G
VRDLIIENGPGEDRAGIFDSETLVELYLERPAETDFWIGYAYTARILSKHAGFAILSLDDSQAIMRPVPVEPDGADISVQLTRLAIPEPGRWKLMQTKRATADAKYRNGHEAWVQADNIAHHRRADATHCEQFQDAIDLALAACLDFPGGSISWERTKAGLVFDVDGDGDAQAVNCLAAAEITRLLRLFQIGGVVLIDFINSDSKNARTGIASAFDAASAGDPRAFEHTAINGFGLMQVVRPKLRPSVLDTLLGIRRATASDETQVVQLLREAHKAQGAGRRSLVTRPALAAVLAKPLWQEQIAKLAHTIGAPVEIVSDPSVSGYGHVHVRPV